MPFEQGVPPFNEEYLQWQELAAPATAANKFRQVPREHEPPEKIALEQALAACNGNPDLEDRVRKAAGL